MNNIVLILYGLFILGIIILGIAKAAERIKEKPKDDEELDKYKKY